jgi:hypothetical protein
MLLFLHLGGRFITSAGLVRPRVVKMKTMNENNEGKEGRVN